MITLIAKISLLSGDNKALTATSTNLSQNNISSDIGAIIGTKKKGSNPFIIGASKLGDGSTFSGQVDYFIDDELCDENGLFEETKTIELYDNSASIKNITIAFDIVNKRYPKELYVGNKLYKSDDPIFTITDLSPSSHHTITFNSWNTPFYPVVITGIYAEVSIEIDRRNLISFERTIYDRGDLNLPSFGIISNAGRIEFNDLDGEISDYAEQQLLDKGLDCEIQLLDTLIENSNQTIGVFETDQWDYDNNSRVVRVSLKDDLEEWQDIELKGISWSPTRGEKNLSWCYEYLWLYTSNRVVNGVKGLGNYNMLGFSELDDKTKEVLEKVYIKHAFLENGTLWQQWTKLCEVGQLHIYKDSTGVIVCKYNGGN